MIFISHKVAIASSVGKVVNQHFGRAKQFLIVEINDNGTYEFLEIRKNTPTCNVGGHDASMEDTLDLIFDCERVLVSQVGQGAADALISRGIQPIIIPLLIDDAIKKVYSLLKESKGEDGDETS